MHLLLHFVANRQRFLSESSIERSRGPDGVAKAVSIVLLASMMLMGCGDGDSPTPLTAPQMSVASATPSASATATVASITYRLAQGSTIAFTAPTPGTAPAAIQEPISGAFDVVRVPAVPPTPTPVEGNAADLFAITRIAFQSSHFTITGAAGGVGTSTIRNFGVVGMSMSVSINGQEVQLAGEGPRDLLNNADPPSIGGLEICGAAGGIVSCDSLHNGSESGFSLTIFAMPEE